MKKLSLQALSDFIAEPEEMNMELFIHSINPFFKKTKSSKAQLTALIEKYKKDSSKLRLKAIEDLLAATKSEKIKIKEAPKIKTTTNTDLILTMSPDEIKKAQEESELNLIFSILGDWRIEDTDAWEILYGKKPNIAISSMHKKFRGLTNGAGKINIDGINMRDLIRKLERYSGRRSRISNLEDNYNDKNQKKEVEFVFNGRSGYWLITFNGQYQPQTFVDNYGTTHNENIINAMKNINYMEEFHKE